MSRRVAVVGGGITGLAAAYHLADEADVVVLEAAERLGGQIRTRTLAGARVDVGADAFLARQPEAEQLARTLGLGDHLVAPATGDVQLWLDGRRRPLPAGVMMGAPTSLRGLVRSGALPPPALARAALEPVLPGRRVVEDVSVTQLVGRRFGRAVVERLVEPLLGGVYAGDPGRLSAETATAPLWAAAIRHRSLARGLIATRRHAPAADGPVFRTVAGGLSHLVARLGEVLGERVHTATPVTGLHRDAAGWRVEAPGLGDERFDAVVLAVPVHVAARLLTEVAPEAAAGLASIATASVGVVSLAYPHPAAAQAIPGSGVLVPRRERRLVKAVTISSRKWPHLADESHFLLRASVGRIDEAGWRDLDDAALTERVDAEVRELVGLEAAPAEALVTRWDDALPQYEVGHAARTAAIRHALPEGLLVGGAAFGGLGLPARVRDAAAMAARLRAGWDAA